MLTLLLPCRFPRGRDRIPVQPQVAHHLAAVVFRPVSLHNHEPLPHERLDRLLDLAFVATHLDPQLGVGFDDPGVTLAGGPRAERPLALAAPEPIIELCQDEYLIALANDVENPRGDGE